MILAKFVLAILFFILLYLVYRYFPNRKIFLLFCFLLAGMAFFLTFSYHQTKNAAPLIADEEKQELLQQQYVFSSWYNDYEKNFDSLDHNWQQYHQILQSFKNDEISIQTTYVRLSQLEADAAKLRDNLSRFKPPAGLSNANSDLTTKILQKTRAYTNAQYQTILRTKEAADPAHLLSDNQEEQSRRLQEIMIMNTPANLVLAPEISTIKDNLLLPKGKE